MITLLKKLSKATNLKSISGQAHPVKYIKSRMSPPKNNLPLKWFQRNIWKAEIKNIKLNS